MQLPHKKQHWEGGLIKKRGVRVHTYLPLKMIAADAPITPKKPAYTGLESSDDIVAAQLLLKYQTVKCDEM